MEARELRIGNNVLYNGKVISISPVGLNEIYYLGDSHSKSTSDKREYKPIPLTEEWLLKLGFEKALNGYWDASENWCVRENKLYVEAQTYLSKVDFVHQLQNLFYALCGYELQLKDTQITK